MDRLSRGGADEVEGEVADGGHVPGAMALAEAGLVVGEGDVEHPVQAVLDRPVPADRGGGVGRGEGAGGDEVAGLGAGRAPGLDAGLGADEAGGAGQAQLAREAAGAVEPVGLAEHGGAALLDAAVALVEVGRGSRARRPASAKAASTSARRLGWLALTASSQSAPWAVIARAMSALVAMASMETSAPFSPSSAPSRSRSGGMAASSFALSGTASCASTRRAVVAKAETRCSGAAPGAAVVAAARGLAVDRHEIGLLRPALPHPGGEGGGEERGVDPVHQDGEPALAGNAVLVGQVPAEEVEMRRAPGGDVLVVVAVGDGAADDEQQDLRQRMQDPPHVARVLDLGEVIEQRREARLPGQGFAAG